MVIRKASFMQQNDEVLYRLASNSAAEIGNFLTTMSRLQVENAHLKAKVQELTIQKNALRKGSEKNEFRGHNVTHQQNRDQNQQQPKKD